MGKLRKFTSKILKKSQAEKSGNGLYASLEELMDMRKQTAYLQNSRKLKSYSTQVGDIKSAFKGRGIEMEEIRPYQYGDDVRDIDWRVTARKHEPYTKIYQEERDYEIYVWLDLSAMMLFGSVNELKSVTAAKVAALLGWVALDNKDRFGCVIFDGEHSWLFKPKADRSYLAAILKKIATVSKASLEKMQNSDEERLKSLKLLQTSVKGKASVFVISSLGSWSDAYNSDLAALTQKTNLFLIDIFDALEEKAPKGGQYMATYGDDKLVFDSSDKIYQKEYAAYFAQRRVERENFCRRLGCKTVHLSPDMSIVRNLKIF